MKLIGLILLWIALICSSLWAAAALAIDMPTLILRVITVAAFLALLLFLTWRVRGAWRKAALGFVPFLLVLAWWLTLSASNDRNWQPDVARIASAEIDGDRIVVHNLRNADYRTELDYTPRWETREYSLKDLRGIDLFITYWGSPWIAHPIVSFDFGAGGHLAISVETRKQVGEEYSALLGFFRQYELIYVLADERDLIRLRTNYRTGEIVYLYRTTANAATARAVLLGYLQTVNQLAAEPVWYNAVTSNCTTGIRIHTVGIGQKAAAPWDWRLLLNGKVDEYAYQYGRLAGDLPFEALKQQAIINDVAHTANDSPDFSSIIRRNRAGFTAP